MKENNLVILIPTMRRKTERVPFEYLRRTMKYSKFPKFCRIYFFVNESDVYAIKMIIKRIYGNADNFFFILRDETKPLYEKLNSKDKFKYWQSHLCLDFYYSMSELLEREKDETNLMWLEDDTVINFNKFDRTRTDKTLDLCHFGFCCIYFSRENLVNFLERVPQHAFSIPIDWISMPKTASSVKCAFHTGEISSRDDSRVVRINELNKVLGK